MNIFANVNTVITTEAFRLLPLIADISCSAIKFYELWTQTSNIHNDRRAGIVLIYIYTVELGYNVMKGTEYFVSL